MKEIEFNGTPQMINLAKAQMQAYKENSFTKGNKDVYQLHKVLMDEYSIYVCPIPPYEKDEKWWVQVESIKGSGVYSNLLWESDLDGFDTYLEALTEGVYQGFKYIATSAN
jgi:hypothetical protein